MFLGSLVRMESDTSEINPDLAAKIADANDLRAAIRATENAHKRQVVDAVTDYGLTTREAGRLFGVAHRTIGRWVEVRYPGYYGNC